jgi:hypothetical protein
MIKMDLPSAIINPIPTTTIYPTAWDNGGFTTPVFETSRMESGAGMAATNRDRKNNNDNEIT